MSKNIEYMDMQTERLIIQPHFSEQIVNQNRWWCHVGKSKSLHAFTPNKRMLVSVVGLFANTNCDRLTLNADLCVLDLFIFHNFECWLCKYLQKFDKFLDTSMGHSTFEWFRKHFTTKPSFHDAFWRHKNFLYTQ